jgi:proline racemase
MAPEALDSAGATQSHGPQPPEVAMRSDRVIATTDFHTAGIGMRLVTSGLGRLPGATMAEKRRWFQERLDHLRTGLCLEPRGHRSLLIAVMTDPVTEGAHFGLFFIYPGGYYVSCGEGTIGAATVALETGLVAREGPNTRVVIDTEVGPIETIAHSDGERVEAVTLRWTPSFVVLADQTVEVDGLGELQLDIAVGVGNVFAVVDAARAGVAVRREHARTLAGRGMAVREAVNAQLDIEVPGCGKTPVDNVLLHELPDAHGVSPNALVWGPGQVDAAPCGSGTCARMALFHHRRLMAVGSTLVSRGLLGLDFRGRIAGETRVDGHPAILPEVTGTAYLTGFSQFLFDPADPLRAGFLLDA